MTQLDKHPALMEVYELIQSIEKLGASVELTNTVIQAGKLMRTIEDMVDGWKIDATCLEDKIGKLVVELVEARAETSRATEKLLLVYTEDGKSHAFGTEEDVKNFRIRCAGRIENLTREAKTFEKRLLEEKLRRELAVLALESRLRIKEEANAVLMDAMHRMETDYHKTFLIRVLAALRTVTLNVPVTFEISGRFHNETIQESVKAKLPMAYLTKLLQDYTKEPPTEATFSSEV